MVGFVWLDRQNGGPRPAPPKQFSDAELRQLLADKTHAIALLENNKLAEADAAFAELAKKLPDEPLVLRNRAIGRLLALEGDFKDADLVRAQDAIQQLLAVEPSSFLNGNDTRMTASQPVMRSSSPSSNSRI